MAGSDPAAVDYVVKLLLVGDSGVGKSSLLLRFIDDVFEDVSPTIGVDFKIKLLSLRGKRLKLTVWDTAGQERFRTLTSSYYRGAQGIVLVYDITSRPSFTNLEETWQREVALYCTVPGAVRLVLGNKADLEGEQAVSRAEGVALARAHGALFLEVSARSGVSVVEAFDELVSRVMDSPELLPEAHRAAAGGGGGGAGGGSVTLGGGAGARLPPARSGCC